MHGWFCSSTLWTYLRRFSKFYSRGLTAPFLFSWRDNLGLEFIYDLVDIWKWSVVAYFQKPRPCVTSKVISLSRVQDEQGIKTLPRLSPSVAKVSPNIETKAIWLLVVAWLLQPSGRWVGRMCRQHRIGASRPRSGLWWQQIFLIRPVELAVAAWIYAI
jgi:hypothetical protein